MMIEKYAKLFDLLLTAEFISSEIKEEKVKELKKLRIYFGEKWLNMKNHKKN